MTAIPAADQTVTKEHNQPADWLKGILDPLRPSTAALIENANLWLQNVAKIADDEAASRAADFIARLKGQIKLVDGQRREAKKPVETELASIDDYFGDLIKPLKAGLDVMLERQTLWLQEVQRRQNEERIAAARRAEEARKLAEAAAAKPVQSVADKLAADEAQRKADELALEADAAQRAKAQVRGDFAPRAQSLRTSWSAQITDWDAATHHYFTRPEVKAAVQKLADADVRVIKAEQTGIPGVRGVSSQKAV